MLKVWQTFTLSIRPLKCQGIEDFMIGLKHNIYNVEQNPNNITFKRTFSERERESRTKKGQVINVQIFRYESFRDNFVCVCGCMRPARNAILMWHYLPRMLLGKCLAAKGLPKKLFIWSMCHLLKCFVCTYIVTSLRFCLTGGASTRAEVCVCERELHCMAWQR